ncbi:MAG: hemerythrin domain-containing protein, partial [Acidimicrobiales bacterium]
MVQRISKDIVQALTEDHQKAKALLERFESVAPNGRAEYFTEVVHDLVTHEVAEELVVYPAIRSDAPNGNAEADVRIAEQSEAEELLSSMEGTDPMSEGFVETFKA